MEMARAKLQRIPAREERQPNRAALTEEAIAERAYALYLARGGEDGHDVEDWLQAERELQGTNDASCYTNVRDLEAFLSGVTPRAACSQSCDEKISIKLHHPVQ